MGTMIRRNWVRGYTPSQNVYTGDPNGLLIAQNLTFDEKGAVRLSKGTLKVSTGAFTGNGEAIYSSVFDLATLIDNTFPGRAKVRYVGQTNGSLLRNYDPTNKTETDFGMTIFSGGNTKYTLGSCFGHTLCFSGSMKYKDRGDVQHVLGISAPSAPGVSVNTPPFVNADDRNGSSQYDNWDTAAVEGTSYAKAGIDYIAVTTAALTNWARGIIQRGILTTSTLNLNTLSSGVGTSNDLFAFNVRLENSEDLIKIRVEYLLDSPTASSTTPDVENYYWREWTNRQPTEITTEVTAPDFLPEDMTQEQIDALVTANPGVSFIPSIREGANVWCTLQCTRGDFARVGADDSKDWSTVKGIRISYYTVSPIEVLFNEARFIGGTAGQLTGSFTYIQQDLRDTNSYIEYGMPSSETTPVATFGSSNQISPTSPNTQANGFRIYRLSNATDGFYVVLERTKVRIETFSNANPGSIHATAHGLTTGDVVAIRDGYGNWAAATGSYIVTVTGPNDFTIPLDTSAYGAVKGDMSYVNYSPFADNVTDAEAVYGGALNRLDRNKSLLPDDIIGMVGPYYTRALYLTPRVLVPSEQNDPSRYDTRYQLELASDSGEINLFIAKVAEGLIYIGTTKDIYVLQGDGTVVDSVMNFKLTGLGVTQPPISSAFAVYDSTLYYLAMDGWRRVSGSSNSLLSEELRLMFPPGSETRYTFPAYRILPLDGAKTSAVIIGDKLYAAMDQGSIGRSLLVYDFTNRRWEHRYNDTAANNPYAMFVEEDGTMLFTTESSGDKYLHQAEVGYKYDGTTNQPVKLLTVFDDNEQPNNRKDGLTLFLDLDSGNSSLSIEVRALRDDDTYQTLSLSRTFNGRVRTAIDLSTLVPTKRFQVYLYGNVAFFAITEIYLEYQARPTQMNFLRIPPNNYGVAGRKRISEIPILIDTLGNTVTFTPILDNSTETGVNFVKTDKDVYHHVFNAEKAAYVVGGTLTMVTSGGVFEFYDMITPREVEVLPDPISYKHIPYTNLGTGSRKRFIQFAFIIDTRGQNVTFTPYVDGSAGTPATYNTSRRQTVVYTFATETVGIDIGGILDSVTDNQKFEYYGVDLGECLSEKLPPAAKFFRIPCSNFGTAGRKRLRTIPLVIDTKGQNVTYTPYVDGVAYATSTFNTSEKRTVLHYFTTDAFGIDFCGTLSGASEFEFYGMLSPEKVEELPVGKKYDQVGPLELKRIGRIYKARVRLVPTGASVSYDLIIDGSSAASGTWAVTPDREQVVEITFPKFVMGVIAKLELNSSSVFHRMYAELLIRFTGNDTENKWVKIA